MDNPQAPFLDQDSMRTMTRIAIVLGLGSLCLLLGLRQLARPGHTGLPAHSGC